MLHRIIGEDVQFLTELDPKLHNIKADTSQIEQILLNLVINAREAMPKGGELRIQTQNISLSSDSASLYNLAEGSYVQLRISDTGCGIPPESVSKIFEPFYSTKEISKGTGLGLSTVYGIVSHNGGKILVDSTVGQGSTFTILLPITTEVQITHTFEEMEASFKGDGELVLLVEDDSSVRRLMKKNLVNLGYKIAETDSGEQALKLLQTGLNPDLMITDIVMPGIDGYELCNMAKSILPHLKIILISGYSESTLQDSDSTAPHYPYIQKPFTIENLAKQVKNSLPKNLWQAKLNILMIDDDEDIRILVKRSSAKRGHEFCGAASLDEALYALQTQVFDIILVDMHIPGSDGISIISKIRESGYTTPIMILSGTLFQMEEAEIEKYQIAS
ncbi:MAG: response regulator, partial [Candidatus Cloacimonadaceae bacterium]|nr:response regulator [Candidatus Cloacimonadaceae bacterium]